MFLTTNATLHKTLENNFQDDSNIVMECLEKFSDVVVNNFFFFLV